MTTATKKNPDYTASAVNLVNCNMVYEKLAELHEIQNEIERLDAVLHALPEYEELEAAQQKLASRRDEVQQAVEKFGSYQDIDNGFYAIKQRKLSKQYNAELFEVTYPEYAKAVLKKAVDTVKLNGLVKGGLLSEDAMRRTLVMTETESFAFIIR